MFSWPGWVGRVLVRGERRALGIFQIGGKRVHTRARDKQAEEEGENPESGRRGAHSHPRRTALVRRTVLRSTRTCRGQQTMRRKHQSTFRGRAFERMRGARIDFWDNGAHLSPLPCSRRDSLRSSLPSPAAHHLSSPVANVFTRDPTCA